MATLIRRDNRDISTRGTERGFDPFRDPFRIVDALLGDTYNTFDPWSAARGFAPTFEVKETKNAYVFKADLPGIPEKDVEIQMTGNVLTISGERRQESVQEGERYFALERGYGRFSRAFSLPDGTDAENVTADMKEGVLTVRVPKRPEVQAKKITIGSGKPLPGQA
jgi:HSP20 family protein